MSEWGDCADCGEELITWNTIVSSDRQSLARMAVEVRCPNCGRSEMRTTPSSALEDLKALERELRD